MNATLKHPHNTQNTANAAQQLSQHDSVGSPAKSGTAADSQLSKPVDSVARPAVTPPPSPAKPLEKGRFAAGLMLSSAGITLLLFVAVGMLQQMGLNGWFSLPLIALTAIGGVMMLGGGFGLMATAAPGFDDGEFERLMEAGNISNVCDDAPQPTDNAADAAVLSSPAAEMIDDAAEDRS